jgi:hypothetical protein
MPGVELRVRATGLARAWPVPTPRSSLPFGVVPTSACVVRFEIWYIQILITSARLHAFISSHLISSHFISSHHLTLCHRSEERTDISSTTTKSMGSGRRVCYWKG